MTRSVARATDSRNSLTPDTVRFVRSGSSVLRRTSAVVVLTLIMLLAVGGVAGALPSHGDDPGSIEAPESSENGHVHKHDPQDVASRAGGGTGTVLLVGGGLIAVGAIAATVVVRRRRTPAAS